MGSGHSGSCTYVTVGITRVIVNVACGSSGCATYVTGGVTRVGVRMAACGSRFSTEVTGGVASVIVLMVAYVGDKLGNGYGLFKSALRAVRLLEALGCCGGLFDNSPGFEIMIAYSSFLAAYVTICIAGVREYVRARHS